jgi:hypothetical protein
MEDLGTLGPEKTLNTRKWVKVGFFYRGLESQTREIRGSALRRAS